MNLHQTGNIIEAVFWMVLGAGFAWRAIYPTEAVLRKPLLIAAGTFLVFGLSDVIEIFTGAWWRPWWLLLLKGVCILILLGLYIDYRFRHAKAARGGTRNG